ncbi:MAG TPA: uroporphyrinogen decarboxylase family protein [Candidatus Latescibacteria bacterium]|nr:uroporphyrinogen decarboxylase family protein [Candidatus Latescibacterota bacterium]HOF60185.1 uroporphyrinogen decarboxylase family protein [Candidatus Latescibacterota bacterium]HOS63467.1 uroporphyrinogen decarboxylase family protein [Candidatus Latescibacterota bacterium]HPK73216.1 uroporphyrinogen decarboxylase family protein [Candidatus Latescibacterota bacterium]
MIPYEGKNPRTVNFLKTLYFDTPQWVPCGVSLMMATWMKYREELEAVVLAHPRIFPGYVKGSINLDFPDAYVLYEPGYHTDNWGCVWHNIERGLDSIVVKHALENWDDFANWKAPDPLTQADFGGRPSLEQIKSGLAAARDRGDLAGGGGLAHGFFYMRLFYLRGFENLMMDFANDDPRLHRLIQIIEGYNVAVIQQYLEAGAEYMSFGEDLGTQKSLPISPAMWRKFIKPSYEAMFAPCRDRDIPVYLHSDGHILEIIPDLIDVGIRMINPQIRANTLEGIRDVMKGRIAIALDLDRQLFPFASFSEIEDHIAGAYDALNMKEGGLTMGAECEPDVPLERIDWICSVLERVCKPPLPEELGEKSRAS